MSKSSWLARREEEAVSPVVATILLVGITVVLAATLYVMVFGFGANTSTPPVASFTRSSIQNGFKFIFTPFSRDTTWDKISIVLSDDSHTISFNNTTAASLSGSTSVTHCFGSRTLGSLGVWMNATDLVGNGYVNQGDLFTLTASGGHFAKSMTYSIYLIYKPTGDAISPPMQFTGD